jgi:hypothetical protein
VERESEEEKAVEVATASAHAAPESQSSSSAKDAPRRPSSRSTRQRELHVVAAPATSKHSEPSPRDHRVGTRAVPHEKKDGSLTQKLTFTAPHGLHREIDLFCLQNNLVRHEWIVSTLQEAMARHGRGTSRD